jgi:hypothetical protein
VGSFPEDALVKTGDNASGFKDGFCRPHPLMSRRMKGKTVKIVIDGQTGLISDRENAG